MTNAKVMQQFISGIKNEGHNTNQSIFFEGDVVFSYGYHFPLGIKFGGELVVNCDSYSNTTAKHRNELLSAHGYGLVIDAPTEAMKELRNGNLQEFKNKAVDYQKELIAEAESKIKKVRTARMGEFWNDRIAEARKQTDKIRSLNK